MEKKWAHYIFGVSISFVWVLATSVAACMMYECWEVTRNGNKYINFIVGAFSEDRINLFRKQNTKKLS